MPRSRAHATLLENKRAVTRLSAQETDSTETKVRELEVPMLVD